MIKTFEEYRHFAFNKYDKLAKDPYEPFFNKKKKEYKESNEFMSVNNNFTNYLRQYLRDNNINPADILNDTLLLEQIERYINEKLIGEVVKVMANKVKKPYSNLTYRNKLELGGGGKISRHKYNWLVADFSLHYVFTLKSCKLVPSKSGGYYISILDDKGNEYLTTINGFFKEFMVRKETGRVISEEDPYGEENWVLGDDKWD